MGIRYIVTLFMVFPILLFSQMEEKKKFIKENHVHLKAGATFNNTNAVLFESLNSVSTDVFTPSKNIYYNPSVDVEFECHFSKYVGLGINLGFMQTRQRYDYTGSAPGTYISNNSNSKQVKEPTGGLILANIPHLNLAPAFYITNDTRIYAGLGLYKYYYHFDPIQIGNFGFNLNAEGISVYSGIGISQSFDINRWRCSLSISCFGLTKKYDSGIQLGLGIVL